MRSLGTLICTPKRLYYLYFLDTYLRLLKTGKMLRPVNEKKKTRK